MILLSSRQTGPLLGSVGGFGGLKEGGEGDPKHTTRNVVNKNNPTKNDKILQDNKRLRIRGWGNNKQEMSVN